MSLSHKLVIKLTHNVTGKALYKVIFIPPFVCLSNLSQKTPHQDFHRSLDRLFSNIVLHLRAFARVRRASLKWETSINYEIWIFHVVKRNKNANEPIIVVIADSNIVADFSFEAPTDALIAVNWQTKFCKV